MERGKKFVIEWKENETPGMCQSLLSWTSGTGRGLPVATTHTQPGHQENAWVRGTPYPLAFILSLKAAQD